MAVKVPIRTVFDGSTATGLAEYQSGEFIGLTHGGIGASLSIGSAGQVLKVNSGASALEFGSVEAILNIDNMTDGSSITIGDTDDFAISDAGTEKKVNASQIKTYIADVTLTTAAQTNITSLGTLTALQVDNININGNAITSTAGTDLTITPLSGQQIVLDGTIVVDAGVVTGATSITSTALVGALTGNSTTATALATARTIGGTSFDGSANIAVALATLATTVTITDNESTDEDNALIFTAGGDVDGGDVGLESDGTLTYNPSTGVVTATGFVGALTGNVTGNASGTAATVTGAAQANITSVGTLTTLTVDNIIINGANIGHTSDTDSIAIASDGVATLSQKDVHSVGLSVKNGATSAGFIEFFEDSNNGTNKVTLIGPASTADVTLTLGSTTGTVATTDDIAGEATALAIALG
tara:strand:- start:295 stop:1539 length:1245 start_codon:yes stop_codon:yes gene_type:complete